MKQKIKLIKQGIGPLYKRLEECDLCPRNCRVNRLAGEIGYCGLAEDLMVYTSFLHTGEEPGISEGRGSGTIFFSGCNLKCIYCQNHKFSHLLEGKVISKQRLAQIMVNLQAKEASNINLVTPTHLSPQILEALLIALEDGLNIPLVYNTSGYEKKEVIEQLEAIVDIYLCDLKYVSDKLSNRYSKAPKYAIFALESLKEMARQVKPLWDKNTLKKGLIIRHLVLPNHIDESKKILSWISQNIPQALVSIMSQYQPYFKANLYPEINRRLAESEYKESKEFVEELGLEGWVQEFNPQAELAGVNFSPHLEI